MRVIAIYQIKCITLLHKLGDFQAIAITKEDVVTLQSFTKSPPIVASSQAAALATAYVCGLHVYCLIDPISACGQKCSPFLHPLNKWIGVLRRSKDIKYETN